MFIQRVDIYTRFCLAVRVSRITSPSHYASRKWPADRGLEQGGVFPPPHVPSHYTPPYDHVW